MQAPPRPADEAARLEALHAHEILDTPPERAFDDLVELAAEICGTPIALVSLVDGERQWFKAAVGVQERSSPRELSFCAHAILDDDLFVVPDTAADERFRDNPFVIDSPNVRSYAGAPLKTTGGHKLGTLCVIDRFPRELTKQQRRALRTLANEVEARLELRLRVRELEKTKADLEAQNARLVRLQRQNDTLAELLVHDLKNPIAAIIPNAAWIADVASSEDERAAARDIADAADAMHRMVLDLLDVWRREEGGLRARNGPVDVQALISDVCARARARARDLGRAVVASPPRELPVLRGDVDLLRRVLDNLVENALRYAPRDTSIRVGAATVDGEVELRVADDGPGVPLDQRERIFEKYAQVEEGGAGLSRASRGLGLAFCRIAIEAHGGRIWAEEDRPAGSAFIVRIPLDRACVPSATSA